jgi:hypothetical protein
MLRDIFRRESKGEVDGGILPIAELFSFASVSLSFVFGWCADECIIGLLGEWPAL